VHPLGAELLELMPERGPRAPAAYAGTRHLVLARLQGLVLA